MLKNVDVIYDSEFTNQYEMRRSFNAVWIHPTVGFIPQTPSSFFSEEKMCAETS